VCFIRWGGSIKVTSPMVGPKFYELRNCDKNYAF
jgi:hypothetical protein